MNDLRFTLKRGEPIAKISPTERKSLLFDSRNAKECTNRLKENPTKKPISVKDCITKQTYTEKEKATNNFFFYVKNILKYFDLTEKTLPHDFAPSETNPIIDQRQKAILFNTLCTIADRSGAKQRSMFLAAEIFDICVNKINPDKEHINLIGYACLLIAAKIEDIQSQSLEDFAFTCSRSLRVQDLIKAESDVLHALNFEAMRVLPFDYFVIFSRALRFNEKAHAHGLLLLSLISLNPELSAKSKRFLAFVACFVIAKMFYLKEFWGSVTTNGTTFYIICLENTGFTPITKRDLWQKTTSYTFSLRLEEIRDTAKKLASLLFTFSKAEFPGIYHRNLKREFTSSLKFYTIPKDGIK